MSEDTYPYRSNEDYMSPFERRRAEEAAEEARVNAAQWERAQASQLAKYQRSYARHGEIRIGDQVFIRHYFIANEMGISPRLANWITNGTPSGRMLEAMHTIRQGTPSRPGLYISQKDRQWLLENSEQAKTRRRISQAASPNPL